MFKFGESLKVAHEILVGLHQRTDLQEVDFTIKVFDNNREQGYRVVVEKGLMEYRTIAFAQQHSSDSIVVYCYDGIYMDKVPEAFWENEELFTYNKPYLAADYIEKKILEWVSSTTK